MEQPPVVGTTKQAACSLTVRNAHPGFEFRPLPEQIVTHPGELDERRMIRAKATFSFWMAVSRSNRIVRLPSSQMML